ncbi:hypothetical protein [Variovorax sp. YR566]|uniref:hypothetical protein n=1 Tax=Variovorax sp. YR566 TaxID=3450237 RepID=UPI003F821E30
MTSRYAGRPFLRLLEFYVLDAIGQLDERYATTLQRMEPKLQETYGMQGSWSEIVRAQMQFPDSLPEKIRLLWERNLESARASDLAIDPERFAEVFVDQNFPAAS